MNFESFPMLILQGLIIGGVIDCPELLDDESGKNSLIFSFVTTVLSLAYVIFDIYL